MSTKRLIDNDGRRVIKSVKKNKLNVCLIVVENVIRKINKGSPGGLIHLHSLNKYLKRPIKIWENNKVLYTLGKETNGKTSIDVEYNNGHWSLRGGKDPVVSSVHTNDCLFSVVCSQTGLNTAELRKKTAATMYRRRKAIARMIVDSDDDPSEFVNCMIGGARYAGRSANDAKMILDASQNGSGHPDGRSGHPRGHASYPSGTGSTDSIENYSMSRWRSGFLSRNDQDFVAHYSLVTSQARDLMFALNSGQFKVAEHISRNSLDTNSLPKAQIWSGGLPEGQPHDFRTVCLVGKHFLNQHNDANANIFVLTFYPIL